MRDSDAWKYRQNVIHILYLPEYRPTPTTHTHSSIFRKTPTKKLLNFVYNLKVTLNFSYDTFTKKFLHYVWVKMVIKGDRMDIKIIYFNHVWFISCTYWNKHVLKIS
jgi:hypothetical protein